MTEKINCANPKDNYGIRFIKKKTNVPIILACLIRLQLSKHNRVLKALTYMTYSTTDMYSITIATTALKSNSSNSPETLIIFDI